MYETAKPKVPFGNPSSGQQSFDKRSFSTSVYLNQMVVQKQDLTPTQMNDILTRIKGKHSNKFARIDQRRFTFSIEELSKERGPTFNMISRNTIHLSPIHKTDTKVNLYQSPSKHFSSGRDG